MQRVVWGRFNVSPRPKMKGQKQRLEAEKSVRKLLWQSKSVEEAEMVRMGKKEWRDGHYEGRMSGIQIDLQTKCSLISKIRWVRAIQRGFRKAKHNPFLTRNDVVLIFFFKYSFMKFSGNRWRWVVLVFLILFLLGNIKSWQNKNLAKVCSSKCVLRFS